MQVYVCVQGGKRRCTGEVDEGKGGEGSHTDRQVGKAVEIMAD